MKKIIISIIPHLTGGGIERIVTQISSGLIREKNTETHIITTKPYSGSIPHDKSIIIHNLDITKRNKFNFRRTNKYKSKFIDNYIFNNISKNPDLVLAHQESTHKCMKYSTLNNLYFVIHSNISKSKLKNKNTIKRMFSILKLYNLYKNKNCICVSKGIKTDLENTFYIHHASVIYNAIDIKETILVANEPYNKLKNDYYIHVGNFTDAKRQDRLVESFIKSKVDKDLIMIGGGNFNLPKIKNIISSHKLKDKIKILGFKENPYPYIKDSQGLILSSDFEGFGMVLLEALALNIPIISTNCKSGPIEIVGEEGLHCLSDLTVDSLSEKIVELDKNPEKFKIKINEKFMLSYCIEQYYKLIK
ncbi:glycosyltransferase [Aliivibrio fischeri]|uniref:Glycosyl transferase n=1 Tax=Aliivibrio fischeri TaxID=668 RepID=A0A510UGH2_ALIFS|nr:glycosyltransferase [Aliivibrio fischeri]GEK13732.1 glycosyl transferase [Aliivibrio fischeri]